MKYSINLYGEDGDIRGTYGTDYVSTNTFIKAVKTMQEIEGEKDIAVILGKLATVVSYLIPCLNVEEIKESCDVADLMNLVKQVVAKMNNVETSKN